MTGKVAKFEFDSEDALFAKLADELAAQIEDTRGLAGISSPLRNYEAIELVHTRLEATIVDGPFKKRRGGIDIRRDGSSEGWLGGASKALIEPRPGETLTDALRREIDLSA
ncbi:MAG: hypothetical protein JHD02_10115 [Thermoleophilaceae bacterium]|nr:hypothetical protein [Thermoleophilaceae bacterium]